MKNSFKCLLIAGVTAVSFSSCTLGDKGSEKVPDSIKIDTNIKASQPVQQKDSKDSTTLIDSLQTDHSKPVKK
ncbi:putative small lipoprotein YifL [Pedobacter cryoconitis]|uniref:Putative small lipoprotein YifL n=1 Tax=Pedobacter cryoconitis TaxID=188932 RepID=A0A7W8ZMF2_9SPHI|nr:hypothetical protein [Pedobacter cryoconitis]MBB5636693.1 putative small lipoprotein YifL [Pedobacter cryoconitis]MBB6274687.1 putative small lipoprotein YifL [Pedobacter cryoconitis]